MADVDNESFEFFAGSGFFLLLFAEEFTVLLLAVEIVVVVTDEEVDDERFVEDLDEHELNSFKKKHITFLISDEY